MTDKEKDILERIKQADPENFGPKFKTMSMPQLNIIRELDLPNRQQRVIMDEMQGKTGNDRSIRPPVVGKKENLTNCKNFRGSSRCFPPFSDPTQDKKKQISYLDLLRCGGKSHRLAAKKKKEKPKAKYRS